MKIALILFIVIALIEFLMIRGYNEIVKTMAAQIQTCQAEHK